jgi:type I restriction enzyme S subunit
MTANTVPPHWRASTYGDVMVEVEERAGTRVDLPVLSLTKAHGPMLASERFSKVLHSRDISRYRVARRGLIVADPMLLWDGAIGIQRVVDAGLVSPDYRVYAPRKDVDSAFLSYVVRSPTMISHYQGGARGTNVRRNRIARSDFLLIPLVLPPLTEQRKIASILSSLDDTIEAAQAVIDQLQNVKNVLMADLLTRGLPGQHAQFKQTDLGEVPERWEVVHLESVTQRGSGHTPSRSHPEYWDGNIKWVSLQDSKRLDKLYIDDTTAKITPLGIANSSATEHPAGTVVLSRDAGVGKSAITTDVMAVSQHFMAWVCGPRLNNHYLYYWLQYMKPEFERIAVGNTIKTIGLPYFKSLRLALPPRDEQETIANALTAIDLRVFAEARARDQLVALKFDLMSGLLTGDVRVTPDGVAA